MKVFLVVALIFIGASSSVDLTPRVIGGTDAKLNSAPFVVSIEEQTSSGYEHYCGGSIINANWILTAAHCITSKALASRTVIFAGCTNIANPEATCVKRTIASYKNHNLYTGGVAPYDIALIKVNQPYSFSSSVASIALPKANSEPSGDCTLYGWGSVSTTLTPVFPVNLQQVVLPIISMKECEAALGSAAVNVHKTNVCAGPLSGGKGICASDSGGPLAVVLFALGVLAVNAEVRIGIDPHIMDQMLKLMLLLM
uniref:Peptidase S1 domain-containing protein n=1 Tax=Megaselia scalaris TaxID=36166 RepID=T1GLW0_MEGSC